MAASTYIRSLGFSITCLLLLVALVPVTGEAAAVSLCESAILQGSTGREMFGPDGRLVTLTVADDTPAEDCRSIELPVPAAAVRWFTLTDIAGSKPAPKRLSLQGYFDEAEVRVSEVIHAQAEVTTEASVLPFHVELLPYFRSRAFGVEERASLDGNQLKCEAGERTAGITLYSDARWQQLDGTWLELGASGRGEFSFAIADPPREQQERSRELGTVRLTGTAATSRFLVPDNDQRWTSLVILCPLAEASLTLETLQLKPESSAVVERRRATWLWSPDVWRSTPEIAWRIAHDENVGKFFITIPIGVDGAVERSEQLANFIRAAGERNISVWAVVGDRGDVLRENLPALLARADAYMRFNSEHPADASIAGLQLDIEPYLLPGIALAPDYWRQRYIETIGAVHASLARKLPLDVVMPVWWGSHPAWGSRLLDALVLPELSLTVMNYRTNADALRVGAMPFFAWGEQHGKRVSMALEKGRVGVNAGNGKDETRIGFAPAPSGELWLMEIDGIALLVLLDASYAGLPGQAYGQVDGRIVNTSAISFASAPDNLKLTADALEAEWSAWKAFAGLAIHGLDQAGTDAE